MHRSFTTVENQPKNTNKTKKIKRVVLIRRPPDKKIIPLFHTAKLQTKIRTRTGQHKDPNMNKIDLGQNILNQQIREVSVHALNMFGSLITKRLAQAYSYGNINGKIINIIILHRLLARIYCTISLYSEGQRGTFIGCSKKPMKLPMYQHWYFYQNVNDLARSWLLPRDHYRMNRKWSPLLFASLHIFA